MKRKKILLIPFAFLIALGLAVNFTETYPEALVKEKVNDNKIYQSIQSHFKDKKTTSSEDGEEAEKTEIAVVEVDYMTVFCNLYEIVNRDMNSYCTKVDVLAHDTESVPGEDTVEVYFEIENSYETYSGKANMTYKLEPSTNTWIISGNLSKIVKESIKLVKKRTVE